MSQPTDPQNSKVFQRLDRTASYPYAAGEYLRRYAWKLIDCLLVRPSPSRSFGWRRFWLGLFGARLAPTCGTRPSTRILHPWLLTMGSYSIIAERVKVYNLGHITIGQHTVISQNAYLCAGTHDYTQPDLPLQRPPITIGSGVWVCTGAFIGPGVTIGDNAIVGACAVVTKDVPPGVIVAGNPAQVIKSRRLGGE